MNLREIQAMMWKAMTWPNGVQDFLANADPQTRQAFEQTFDHSEGFGRVERVNVYADAYFWRLFEVTFDLYPVTAAVAGRKRFHNLVTDFVLACPSKTPDVRRFALPFATFLADHPIAREAPGLDAVAHIDAAIADAIDRRDERRLDAQSLQAIPAASWPQARFELSATVSLLTTQLDYSALRRFVDLTEPLPDPLPRHPQPRTVVVWRQADHDVYQRTLATAEARTLRALKEGQTFAQACDAAAGESLQDAGPTDVVGWLRKWLEDGLIVGVQTSSLAPST